MEQLNFTQLIKLSKILKKMGFKINLTDFLFGNKFDAMLKAMDCSFEDKKSMIFTNLGIFFIENIYLAENDVYELIASIESKNIDEVKKYTIDEILPAVMNIIVGSFPKTVNQMISINIDEFKKKMLQVIPNLIPDLEKLIKSKSQTKKSI